MKYSRSVTALGLDALRIISLRLFLMSAHLLKLLLVLMASNPFWCPMRATAVKNMHVTVREKLFINE